MGGPGPPGLEPQENAAYYLILKGGANNELNECDKIIKSIEFDVSNDFNGCDEIK